MFNKQTVLLHSVVVSLNRTLLLLLCISFASLVTSCAETPNSKLKIFGGEQTAPGEFASVIGIAYQVSNGYSLDCTGTAIHTNLIVTAGHCFKSHGEDLSSLTPTEINKKIRIYIGSGIEGGVIPEDSDDLLQGSPISKIAVHKDLHLHVSGNADFAYIKLNLNLPSNMIAKVASSQDALEAINNDAKTATMVGYGRRDDEGKGVKFKVTTRISSLSGHEFVLGGEGKDSCQGDSGGPVFSTSPKSPLLIGIISRGASYACGDGGYAGIPAWAMCWIEQDSNLPLGANCSAASSPLNPDQMNSITAQSLCANPSKSQQQTLDALAFATSKNGCLEIIESANSKATLKLSNLAITDLSPLVTLTNIRDLDLEHNQITDIAPLAHMLALESVHLAGNDVRDFSAIPNTTKLWGATWQQHRLEQTTFLKECIQYDSLSNAKKKTIEALKWKTMVEDCHEANKRLLSLKTIRLNDRELSYLRPISDFWKLENLVLSDNPIKSLEALSQLDNLKKLTIVNTNIEDHEPIEHLIKNGLKVITE